MALFRKKLGSGGAPESFYGKPKPKKFNYSSEANSLILEQGLSDLAELSESTVSNIIEDIIIEKVMPENDRAKHYVSRVLFGRAFDLADDTPNKYGIREALKDIFADEAAGLRFDKAEYGGCKEFVELACDLLRENESTIHYEYSTFKVSGDNPMYHLLSCWESVCEKLEFDERESRKDDIHASFKYSQAVKWAREYERTLKNDPSFYVFNIVQFIIQYWAALDNYSYTFRFLASLLRAVDDWADKAEDRIRFKETCETVMTRWDSAKAMLEEEKLQEEIDAILVTYDLANGDSVQVPQGWIVVNPEEGIESKYAGVIEIKNGEKYNAPHFLYFTNRQPGEQMSSEEELVILKKAAGKWPRLTEVQNDVVEIKYGKDGGVLNQKEWMAAPVIGLFNILDKSKYPLGKPPYGAVIIRAGEEVDCTQ